MLRNVTFQSGSKIIADEEFHEVLNSGPCAVDCRGRSVLRIGP